MGNQRAVSGDLLSPVASWPTRAPTFFSRTRSPSMHCPSGPVATNGMYINTHPQSTRNTNSLNPFFSICVCFPLFLLIALRLGSKKRETEPTTRRAYSLLV